MTTKKTHRFGAYGYIPDLPDFRDLTLAVMRPEGEALPTHVDLSHLCPPVYDQGQLGSCTGNSIAAALQFERNKMGDPNALDMVPSRLFIYYNERVKEHTVHSDAGAQIRDGIKVVAKQGACYETGGSGSWPYDISKYAVKPGIECYDVGALDRALTYARVAQTNNDMRACLASGSPIVIGFTVYDSFESDEVAKTGVVPMPAKHESVAGGHAVLIVGYDDPSKRYIVRNSWGANWGQDGYFTIPYEYFENPDLASDLWNITLASPDAG